MRIAFAAIVGLSGFFAYVALAIILADRVTTLHWIVQAVYFMLAGVLWALPAHYLILWAGRR